MNKRQRKKQVMRQKRMIRNTILLVGALLIGFLVFLIFWKPVKKRVDLEVGSTIAVEQFLKKENGKGSFVTNVDEIDTSMLGDHRLVVKVGFRKFRTKLSIVDTTAPKAEAVAVKALVGTVPKAEECVTDIEDMTEVTITYKEEPNVSKLGETVAIILLQDIAGNVTEVEVPVQVIIDDKPPIITGVQTKEVVVGGMISYRQGVTASDDMDENPELSIDTSDVDLDKVGSYEVIYTAVDDFGNVTSVTGIIDVVPREPVEEPVEELVEEDVEEVTETE